jgi:hypothetical protein
METNKLNLTRQNKNFNIFPSFIIFYIHFFSQRNSYKKKAISIIQILYSTSYERKDKNEKIWNFIHMLFLHILQLFLLNGVKNTFSTCWNIIVSQFSGTLRFLLLPTSCWVVCGVKKRVWRHFYSYFDLCIHGWALKMIKNVRKRA